jgi:hypothetical protein
MASSVEFDGDDMNDPNFRSALNRLMQHQFDEMVKEEERIEKELGVSFQCACDILYLRSRSRWTIELEQKLIALHKAGTPPNVYEFGVTKETQRKLLESVAENLMEQEVQEIVSEKAAKDLVDRLRNKPST